MTATRLFLLAAFGVLRLAAADEPLPLNPSFNLYILRHAQTVGNLTTNYNETTQRQFSEEGWRQIAGIVDKLSALGINQVVASPTFRTQRTVLPFLQSSGLTAELWPSLEECCCDLKERTGLVERIPVGGPLEPIDGAFFAVNPDEPNRMAPTNAPESYTKVVQAAERILARFGQTTNTVLVVNHGCFGGRLIEYLTGHTPRGRYDLHNAELSRLVVGPDGRLRLQLLNDEPVR